jgi:outer membrane usher protein
LGFGNTGALVFQRGGVIAAPPLGETFGIVEVPGGAGARVLGQKSKLGGGGYGVAPYLSPYSSNAVELNLDEAPLDLEITSPTQSVVPMAGAIVRLKYEAYTGLPLLIDFRPVQIKNIPIGAEVTDDQNNNVGMVGQGARAILRVKKPEGTLMISWGDSAKEKCLARYQVSSHDKPNAAGLIKFVLTCVAP